MSLPPEERDLEAWERVETEIEEDRARGAATLARSQRVADVARQKMAVTNGVAPCARSPPCLRTTAPLPLLRAPPADLLHRGRCPHASSVSADEGQHYFTRQYSSMEG